MNAPRVVIWYSHGAASAIATKLALGDYEDRDVVIACIDGLAEWPDNPRFRADCEKWYGRDISLLRSDKYADHWDVIERTGYINGPKGARCTGELKKKVRFAYARPDDLNVFGYTFDKRDAKRAVRFTEQNIGVDAVFPLVERELTKADCLALIERAGIELPLAYRKKYSNNNCLGCVKGGMGYWNKIRVDFPAVFQRMSDMETAKGRTVLMRNGEPLPLADLDPSWGRYESEDPADCSLDCSSVEDEWLPVSIKTERTA